MVALSDWMCTYNKGHAAKFSEAMMWGRLAGEGSRRASGGSPKKLQYTFSITIMESRDRSQ